MNDCDGGMQQAHLVAAIHHALHTHAMPQTMPSGTHRAQTFLMVAWSRRSWSWLGSQSLVPCSAIRRHTRARKRCTPSMFLVLQTCSRGAGLQASSDGTTDFD